MGQVQGEWVMKERVRDFYLLSLVSGHSVKETESKNKQAPPPGGVAQHVLL